MALYELDGVRPELPDDGSAWVAGSAEVIGCVRLGAGASVWFGAVLRGDNDILDVGEDTNVQDGSLLHTDAGLPLTIGRGCTIGHCVILHGCTIGDNTLIGMGTTVLNRARIGANCLVGANALVTEGKEFPDGSLIVGAPARAIRRLEPEEIERLKGSAASYRRNARRFAVGLRKIG